MERILSALDVLTIHRRRITGLTIKADLNKIGVDIASYRYVATLTEARDYLEMHRPHLVILDLCLPNGDAYRLLDAYQPSRRDFAVILMDEEENDSLPRASRHAKERHRGLETLVEHQAAGYLLYPLFHNRNLAHSIEQARGKLQARLLDDYQHEIIEQLLRSTLGHSAPSTPHQKHPAPNNPTPSLTTFDTDDVSFILLRNAQHTHMMEIDAAVLSTGTGGRKPRQNVQKTLTVRYADIIRLEKQDNYVWLHWFNPEGEVKKALLRTEFVPLLHTDLPTGFHKVHRSHIINILHIVEVEQRSVVMRCGNEVPLAAREQHRVQEVLQQFSRQVGVLGELHRLLKEKLK